jgi:hypothetical protein
LPIVDKRFEQIMITIPSRIILCLDYDFMTLDAISSYRETLFLAISKMKRGELRISINVPSCINNV